MNILYLYAELQPYVIIVLKELVKQKDVTVHVVHWDKKKLTPYVPPQIDRVHYYERSQFKTHKELFHLVKSIHPAIVYTSGWMDKVYMLVCKKARKLLSIPVVAGSDTQWRGGKQWINVILAPFFHRQCFSHIQISGIWQYEYARRLGFPSKKILMHNLSADIELFHKIDINRKENKYPKRILYIGRFVEVKGLKYLVEAWDAISDKKSWGLTLIGNGPEKETLIKNKNIEVLDFMEQTILFEYMQNSGCFILPSIHEPWALVLHEAAAAGLPILASNVCGAAPYFVLDDYNGITFEPGNVTEIKTAIEKIINSGSEALITMSYNSRKLSERITPEIVAKTFLSVLAKKA
jgi:glycosyltransferase involved in cell wall biosynthesis